MTWQLTKAFASATSIWRPKVTVFIYTESWNHTSCAGPSLPPAFPTPLGRPQARAPVLLQIYFIYNVTLAFVNACR